MTNHVHLLIATDPPGTLSKIMQGLSLSYAQYFNVKYKKCGHLWQNRYKSKPVQKDQYLINVASYIEYNPIRAKMCHRAEEYPWSSYRERVLEGSNKAIDQIII
jgi:REP element-mobilizing transposase RayT